MSIGPTIAEGIAAEFDESRHELLKKHADAFQHALCFLYASKEKPRRFCNLILGNPFRVIEITPFRCVHDADAEGESLFGVGVAG